MVVTHYPPCAPVRTRVSAFFLWAVRCKINDIGRTVDSPPSLVWSGIGEVAKTRLRR
jgi:hypothetical protein